MQGINLLPWRKQLKQQQIKQMITEIVFCLSFLLLLIAAVHFVALKQMSNQKTINNFLQVYLNKINQQKHQIENLKKQEKFLITQIQNLLTINNNLPQIILLFDLLPRLLPEDVFLTDLEYKQRQNILIGKAFSTNAITEFFHKLEADPRLMKVKLDEIKDDYDGEDKAKQFQLHFYNK